MEKRKALTIFVTKETTSYRFSQSLVILQITGTLFLTWNHTDLNWKYFQFILNSYRKCTCTIVGAVYITVMKDSLIVVTFALKFVHLMYYVTVNNTSYVYHVLPYLLWMHYLL